MEKHIFTGVFIPAKIAKNNYRLEYAAHLGIAIPPDFHVHHIDGERSNCDFSNLVAIPKSLHSDYHSFENLCVTTLITYGFEIHQIEEIEIDERFHFNELTSGRWANWFSGSQDDFMKKCYSNNNKANFLAQIKPAHKQYTALREKIFEYKKAQSMFPVSIIIEK